MQTVRVRVEGRVQGVFFRDYTRQTAQRLGLRGWVRNVYDGSVEALIQGETDTVTEMISWFYTGSPLSAVTHVSQQNISNSETYHDFTIQHSV